MYNMYFFHLCQKLTLDQNNYLVIKSSEFTGMEVVFELDVDVEKETDKIRLIVHQRHAKCFKQFGGLEIGWKQ